MEVVGTCSETCQVQVLILNINQIYVLLLQSLGTVVNIGVGLSVS
jgi:hypothetical protein